MDDWTIYKAYVLNIFSENVENELWWLIGTVLRKVRFLSRT